MTQDKLLMLVHEFQNLMTSAPILEGVFECGKYALVKLFYFLNTCTHTVSFMKCQVFATL